MKVTFDPIALTAVLTAEQEADRALLDAVDAHGVLLIDGFNREHHDGGRRNAGLRLTVNRADPRALRADSARQALGALGKLFSLGLSESANDLHAGAPATDPKAQEQLAASLVKLQIVADALGAKVGQPEVHVEEVKGAHGRSVGDDMSASAGSTA